MHQQFTAGCAILGKEQDSRATHQFTRKSVLMAHLLAYKHRNATQADGSWAQPIKREEKYLQCVRKNLKVTDIISLDGKSNSLYNVGHIQQTLMLSASNPYAWDKFFYMIKKYCCSK